MTKKFFCVECNQRRVFDLEGNIKICSACGTKSSYRYKFRQRWSKVCSNPDITAISPYNRKCDKNTQDVFDEVIGRFRLLSPREQEVVELLWEGKTQYQVAQLLQIGQPRVAKYLERARKKLGNNLQGDQECILGAKPEGEEI